MAEVRRIERRYSRYRAESDLSQINEIARAGGRLRVDAETADLLDHSFAAYNSSGGLFDVSSGPLRRLWNDRASAVPGDDAIAEILARIGSQNLSWRRPNLAFLASGMELDFGGVAKEYAADRAAAACRSLGFRHGVVDLGGDIAIIGPHPDGAPWRIGIRDPTEEGAVAATLFVAAGGVATSGDYERYCEIGGARYSHVINPKTGWPAQGLASVTVVAESCLSAGAASTIGLLMGERAPLWLQRSGAAHVHISRDGELGGSIALDSNPVALSSPTSPPNGTAPSIESFPERMLV